MRHFLLFLLVITLSPELVQAEPELKGTPTELFNYLSSLPKEVTLTGEAKLKIQSESGIVTIGIKTENSKLQKSLQHYQKLRVEIVAEIIDQGITESKIRGTKFSSVPEYGFLSKKPSNYVVENLLTVTVENENELQIVAGIVDNYKEVFYQGIELKEQKREEIKHKLLKAALADAKERQKIYEDDLGIVLKPISFEESISLEKPQLRQKHMDKSEKSYKKVIRGSSHGDDLSLGEHIYHGIVKIKYFVMAHKPK